MISPSLLFSAIVAFLSLPALSAPSTSSASPPTVRLPYSTVQGFLNTTSNLNVFSSIRYAAPPIGDNRWRIAQPPSNVKGTVDVSIPPKRCPQASGVAFNASDPAAIEDEDCLFLSVYSPAGRSTKDKTLPVLLWIHGGGWDHNSIREFDPTPMINSANNSFIAVIIQYRLGVFGFLAPPSSSSKTPSSPNVGITDARAALAWTRENIALFGGDKDKVTIWGQSSGAGTVLHLVAAEADNSPALFRSSIVSSPYLVPMGSCEGEDFKAQFHQFSAAANCTDDLSCLRKAPTVLLQTLDFQFKTILQPGRPSAYEPCIENKHNQDAYLVKNTATQLQDGKVAGSNAIAGSNTHDGSGFAPKTLNFPATSNSTNFTITSDAVISAFLVKDWPLQPADVKKALALYPASQYADAQTRGAAIFQDAVFACPATWLVQAFPESGYRYLYAVTDAIHARDNAYEFPIKYSGLSPVSPTLSASYIGAVTSFIRSSPPNPNTYSSPNLVADEAAWPMFGKDWRSSSFKVLNLTVGGANISTSHIVKGAESVVDLGTEERCTFWGKVRSSGGW